jgi:hypothetical protein
MDFVEICDGVVCTFLVSLLESLLESLLSMTSLLEHGTCTL